MARVARIGSGVTLVLTGAALLVLPGPGLATIAAGLMVLSKDYAWAGDTLAWVKRRYRRYLASPPVDPGPEERVPTDEG